MTGNDDIICVDETPFDENVPPKQLYKTAKKWAREQFQGKTFENKSTGRKIEITGNGIKHAIAKAFNPDVAHSMAVLPEMIERAEFIREEPPKPPQEGKSPEQYLVAVERYETKVRIRGKLYTAELIVKVKNDGSNEIGHVADMRFYYHHNLHAK